MSDEMQQKLQEAAQYQDKLDFYVAELAWKKGKTDLDAFHSALCAGVLTLCKRSEVVLDMLRAYGRYIREIHRHMKEMQEQGK